MSATALAQLVNALEALGLADGVALELAARGALPLAGGELREGLRAVVREELARGSNKPRPNHRERSQEASP